MTRDILLALAVFFTLSAPLCALAMRRQFAARGRINLPLAIVIGAAMHGFALVIFGLAWADRGSLGDFSPRALYAFMASGTLLIIGGAAAIVAGRRAYASFKRVYAMKEDELIEHGIYRWSRNPQYFGYWLMFLGAGLAGRSLSTLILTVIAGAFFHGLITWVEEPHLKRIFKDKYAAYSRRVSRYFGPPTPSTS